MKKDKKILVKIVIYISIAALILTSLAPFLASMG